MPKKKNLNGLPYHVAQSFFSTLNYYKCAYMEDWIINAANKLNLSEATLDVLNATIEPPSLNLYPITSTLKGAKHIIKKELLANNFPEDFIIELKFNLHFPDKLKIMSGENAGNMLYCFPWMKDREGRLYEPKKLSIVSYIYNFDPFDKDLQMPKK